MLKSLKRPVGVAVAAVLIIGAGVAAALHGADVTSLDDSRFVPSLTGTAATTTAVARAEVVSVDPEAVSEFQQLVAMRVDRVLWEDTEKTMKSGESKSFPLPAEGSVIAVVTHLEYEIGTQYDVFLKPAAPSYPAEWQAWFSLTSEGRPAGGTDERLVEDLTLILSDSERHATDAVTALIEFADEQSAVIEARNADTPAPVRTPRTERLREARSSSTGPQDSRLDEWLAIPAEFRPLGLSGRDVPEGAEQALDATWVDNMALIRHQPVESLTYERVVTVTPHGITGPVPLAKDRTVTFLPFVRAKQAPVRLGAWLEEEAEYTDMTGWVDDRDIAMLDKGGGLVIDIRDDSPAMEVVSREQFDQLVLELRP